MKAEQFQAGSYSRQNSRKEKDSENFCTRVSVSEGTRTPSRVRDVSFNPQAGSVHRNSVREFKQHDTNHKPYSSAHRPEQTHDLGALKRNQEVMLSKRQKRKNKDE